MEEDAASMGAVREGGLETRVLRGSHESLHTLFWLVVALISILGVFVLPFAFPLTIPTFSSSYTYGFNNRVAELSTVALSALVLLALWYRRRGRIPAESSPDERMPVRWFVFGSLTVLLFTGTLGGSMIQANVFYSDASHILTQLGRVLRDHASLYTEVEFPYGPLFFYWAAAFQRGFALIGVPAAAAYMIDLACMQIVGLAMLFWVLHWLPLTRRVRGLAFFLFTFGTLTPVLGMNYTLLRFLLPHTLFLAFTRFRSLAAQVAVATVGQMIALGWSPEIGVSFLAGVGGYALYRCITESRIWLLAAVFPLVGSVFFIAAMHREYFNVMGHFAAGAFNLVVTPVYHIDVLLIAAIALSPLAVAGSLTTRNPRAGALLGFYIISLGMLGPVLGRCDPLHTFFGGLGVFLLSLLAVDRLTSKAARLWVYALSLSIVLYQVDTFTDYRHPLAAILFHRATTDDGVDMARLEVLTHGEHVYAPVLIPERVHQELIARGQYQPSYFVYMGGVWEDGSERRKIDEMREVPFALLPEEAYQMTPYGVDERFRVLVLRFGYRYHERFAPWIQGAAIARELQDHWTPAGSVGKYALYRQNGR